MGTLSRGYRPFVEEDPPIEGPYTPPVPTPLPTEVYNPPTPTPPQTGTGSLNLGGGGAGAASADYSFPSYDFGPTPQFKYDPFAAPTFEQAQNEPGYKFRLNSGTDALQRSAAARGVLRTGGTLKDILEYGQNFGAQEYNNVYNRALSAYDRKYQGLKDAFAPQLLQYQLRGQGELAKANAIYGRGTVWNAPHQGSGPNIPPPPDPPDVSSFNQGEVWPEYSF